MVNIDVGVKLFWKTQDIDQIHECFTCKEEIYSKIYYPVIDVFVDRKLYGSENGLMCFCQSCYYKIVTNDNIPD